MYSNNLITVIIPLYNKESIIQETINSVLNQKFTDFELIVVNDGSTDKSIDLISSITDPRIKIFNKENGGVSSARNFGAKLANSKFLFFLDADDQITSDCLFELVELSKDFPNADIFSANFINKTTSGKNSPFCLMSKRGIVHNPTKKFFFRDFMPRTGATLFPRDIFFEIGGFDERISIFEDLEFDMKLMKKYIYAYSPKVVYIHRDEFAELSLKPKPIDKYYSFYIDLNTQSFWEKMELIYCIKATYYKFKGFNDISSCNLMERKLKSHLFLYYINRILLKYLQYRRVILNLVFPK